MEAFRQKMSFRFGSSSLNSSRTDLSEEEESKAVNNVSTPLFSRSEDTLNDIPKNTKIALSIIQNYLHHYSENEFKSCFGVNRSTFHYLSNFLNKNKFSTQLKQISTDKALLITIWYLRNLETLQQISLRFNLNDNQIKRVLHETTSFFTKYMGKEIKWPCKEEADIIKSEFAKQLNITGIIGAIGAYHLKINGQKNKTHLIIQGICDNKHKFTDITCGDVGLSHVAQVLKKSAIYHRGEDGFFENDFLIGTKAYPCLAWLVPPYKDNFSEKHKVFNEKHYLVTDVIRGAFKKVVSRFCRLEHFYNENNLLVKNCVITACFINNVCIDLNDELEEDDCFISEEEKMHDHKVFGPEIFSKRNEVFREMSIEETN